MNVCVLLDLQQRLSKMTISIIMILLEAFCFINPSCYCVIVKYNMLVICNVIAGHDAFRLNGQGFQNMPLLNEVLPRLTTFFYLPYRTDGSFAVNDVPSGSYVVEIVSPSFRFDPVRVDITSKGKMR